MRVKQLVFSIIALFLAFRYYSLLKNLIINGEQDHWGGNLLLAYLLALFVTGVFALPGFVFPTHKLIGKKYYELRNPMQLQKIYYLLRVEYFKRLLLFFFWGKQKNRKKYFNGTRTGIQNFIYQTYQSEFGHLIPFLILLINTIHFFILGSNTLACFLLLINIIGNLYPIILQRHHRIRLKQFL